MILSLTQTDDLADLSDAPGSSLLALNRRQKALGEELGAHVYRYDNKCFLITSLTRPDSGPITETGPVTVVSIDATDAELGRAVRERLLA